MTDAVEGTVPWRALLAETIQRFDEAGVDDPPREARWIVEEASGLTGAELQLALDDPATQRGVARLDALVGRRTTGEPVQYVLGHWPFRSLDLLVDRRVLIPRPETEQVAEVALSELDALIASGRTRPSPRAAVPDGKACVVDLGTGTGALALAIATERPGTDVWAVERSTDAAAVARANLAGVGRAGRRVRVLEGSWFSPLPAELIGRVDLVVTNPPYVGDDEPLDASVADWEPLDALRCGPEGTEALAEILADAPRWLAEHGVVVAEIGHGHASAARGLAEDAGFVDVEVHQDLAGRDRTLVARRAISPSGTGPR